MSIKVSVVVPVYNPGRSIDPTIDSLLAQTMSSTALELIFVDDGSTDDTPARLQKLADVHEHIHVISIPNSGWPGKPRNVGTDVARGEYVMYVDQDDRLDPESLQRMYGLGSANDADIVLGKVTSDFRGVHQYLYREQRARCTVYDSRLINSQTPHKMLRRQFLSDNRIRYPEGRRRLEDQLFMTKAYFAARRCSIVADYVCYRYLKRPDGSNAGERRIDPPSYYENLRDVLDVVDAHTDPGPVRDHFYRRFLRVEMLGKLSGQKLTKTRLERGDIWLVPIRRLAEERFPQSVDDGLSVTTRLRAHLMRHGTFADLKQLTARTRHVHPDVRLCGVSGSGDGTVHLDVTGEFAYDDDTMILEPDGAGGFLLPDKVTGSGASLEHRKIDDVAQMVADLVVVDRERSDEWFIDRSLNVFVDPRPDGGRLRLVGVPRLDPATAAGGRPLTQGRHDLSIRVDALGLQRLRPLKVASDQDRGCNLAVASTRPRTLLTGGPNGNVSLSVGVSAKAIRKRLAPVSATWSDRLTVELGTDWLATSTLRAELTSDRGRQVVVRLAPAGRPGRLWASRPDAVEPGRYRIRVLLPRAGIVTVDAPLVVPRTAARMARIARRRLTQTLRRAFRRLRVAGRSAMPDRRT